MKNKQTAVEWLIQQLKSRYGIYIERLTVTDQAKEMEKQQIMDAWDNGAFNLIFESAEQYYNEEYAKNTNN